MADNFNALMLGAAPAMQGLAQLFAQQRDREMIFQDRQAQREQGASQFLMQQDTMRQQFRQESRRMEQEGRFRQDQLAAAREDNIFRRTQAGMEFQLKLAEQERKDRDTAFTQSLQLMQAGAQAKLQGMQIQQFAKRIELEDAQGELNNIFTQWQLNPSENMSTFLDKLGEFSAERQDILGMSEAEPLRQMIGGLVEMAKRRPTGFFKIEPGLIPGDGFAEGELNARITDSDLLDINGLSPDDFQAWGVRVKQAKQQIEDPDKFDYTAAATELGLNSAEYTTLTEGKKARLAILDHASKFPNVPYWKHMDEQLRDSRGAYLFDQYYEQGLLEPITNKNQLTQLAQVHEAQLREEAMWASKFGDIFYSSPFADVREEIENDYLLQSYTIRAGGNPMGAHILDGGIDSFHRMNDAVKENAVRKLTWGEQALEWSGLAGAGRVITGERRERQDWIDLGLTALLFVPVGGWVAGGALRGARMAAIGTTAKLGTRGKKVAAGLQGAQPGRVGRAGQWLGQHTPSVKGATGTVGGLQTIHGAVWRETEETFGGLNRAAERVDQVVRTAVAQGRTGANDPRVLGMLEEALTEYKDAAARYYQGGKLPLEIELLLDIRRMLPRHLIRAMERDGSRHLAPRSMRSFSRDDMIQQLMMERMSGGLGGGAQASPGMQPGMQSGMSASPGRVDFTDLQ